LWLSAPKSSAEAGVKRTTPLAKSRREFDTHAGVKGYKELDSSGPARHTLMLRRAPRYRPARGRFEMFDPLTLQTLRLMLNHGSVWNSQKLKTNPPVSSVYSGNRPTSSRRRLNNLDEVQFPVRVKNCALDLARDGVCALGALFDLTAPRAVRYARALTRNAHDAEDALQAAMVRVALHPRVLGEAWHPWAYFLRIVRNEALKIVQRKRADHLVTLVVEAWSEDALDAADSRHFVREALRKLPPTQAEVVVLKIWEGMTFSEIAEVLGESPNTAASRYRYALQKLSQYLQPLADEVSHAERSIMPS
jgi:RNA polymerase sigma-70 factor, ECF subfamily